MIRIGVYQTTLAAEFPLPAQAFGSDAAFDLRTVVDLEVHPGEVAMVPTGLVFDLPMKTFDVGGVTYRIALLIEPRTGLGSRRGGFRSRGSSTRAIARTKMTKKGLTLALRNVSKAGSDPIVIKRGERVAQGLFHLVPVIELFAAKAEDVNWDTDRKDGRFGSTGA